MKDKVIKGFEIAQTHQCDNAEIGNNNLRIIQVVRITADLYSGEVGVDMVNSAIFRDRAKLVTVNTVLGWQANHTVISTG